jgi:hypothetical protein
MKDYPKYVPDSVPKKRMERMSPERDKLGRGTASSAIAPSEGQDSKEPGQCVTPEGDDEHN